MERFTADVEKARVLTAAALWEASELGMTVGEAVQKTQAFLEYNGFPAPEDPIAFATGGRCATPTDRLNAVYVARPSGEVI